MKHKFTKITLLCLIFSGILICFYNNSKNDPQTQIDTTPNRIVSHSDEKDIKPVSKYLGKVVDKQISREFKKLGSNKIKEVLLCEAYNFKYKNIRIEKVYQFKNTGIKSANRIVFSV